jgi:hypothetical protein
MDVKNIFAGSHTEHRDPAHYSLDEEKSSSLPQWNDFHPTHFQSFSAEAGKRHSTVVHLTEKSNKSDQIVAHYFLVANKYVCYIN